MRKLLCWLGLHDYALVVINEQRYSLCKHCHLALRQD